MYADDIILLAPSVHVLQSLINICESELKFGPIKTHQNCFGNIFYKT